MDPGNRTRHPSPGPVGTGDFKKECAEIHSDHDRSKDCANSEPRWEDACKEPGRGTFLPNSSATRWQVEFGFGGTISILGHLGWRSEE